MNGQTIGYVRVSSTDQNPARQIAGIGELDRLFTEKVSGKIRERPVLKEMLAYARSGDRLKVLTFDRLARSTRDLLALVEEMTSNGVTIDFVEQNLTFTPGEQDGFAQFQLTLLGAIAQLERTMIGERQAEGIAAAKDRGVYRRQRVLSDEQVKGVQERIVHGVPKSVVAREFGVSRQTIYNALATA